MGSITFNITGGTPDYLVELIPDIGTTWTFNSAGIKTISPIPAGDYHLKVTDANGCIINIGGIVIEPSLKFTFTSGNAPADLSENLIFNAPFVYGDLTQVDGIDTITLTGSALEEITIINVNDIIGLLKIEELINCTTLTGLACGGCNELIYISTLPSSLINLQCSGNAGLTELPSLPVSLTTLDCSECIGLTELPTIPILLSMLDINACNITSTEMDSMAIELDNNGQSDGTWIWYEQTNLEEPNQTAAAYLSLIAKGWNLSQPSTTTTAEP